MYKIYQRNFIKKNKCCVLEGRDASTKILPNSDVKFFFVCSLDVAARRRFNELKKKLKKINFNEVKRALYKRNSMDRTRSISPLQKHHDAVVVNTTKIGKKANAIKLKRKPITPSLLNIFGDNIEKRNITVIANIPKTN